MRILSLAVVAMARIIAIGAAHHRLLWVHPFFDGNGRVTRLMSYAMMLRLGLGSPATLGAPQLARADDGAAPPEGQFPTAQALTLLVVRRGRSSRRIPAALSSPAVGFL